MSFAAGLEQAGAKVLKPVERPNAAKALLKPGLIDITAIQTRNDEECFGPLLQLEWVDTLEDAIDSANNTRYGLSAGLLSDNSEAWTIFMAGIRAGIVNLNRPLTGASGAAPFGGVAPAVTTDPEPITRQIIVRIRWPVCVVSLSLCQILFRRVLNCNHAAQ